MKTSRRSFLKTSGILASGMALGSLSFLKGCSPADRAAQQFGVQLYSLRDVMPDDPRGVLAQLAEFGYHQIESYEGPMGIYWGMSNIEFKNYMDELGMEMVSSHANVFEDFERKAGEAAEIGVDYLICPWIGPQETLDDYREMADQFNEIGEVAQQAGIRFAYHNHAYTFETVDGEYPQDILVDNTDPALVDYQLDLYWVVAAGEDPIEWLEKHSGRYTSSHVKDMINGDDPESTTLGNGIIDYQPILAAAKEHGMEYFIIEQEDYAGTTPIEGIHDGAEYFRGLEF